MRCYLIRDTRITVLTEAPTSLLKDSVLIESAKQLDQKRFPMSRLADLWNAIPGVDPIPRFKDRPTAIRRLWSALESLPVSATRADSKQARLIGLLKRPYGASMEQMTQATGWQSHSVRGAMSGVLRKRLGLNVTSAVTDEERRYRISA